MASPFASFELVQGSDALCNPNCPYHLSISASGAITASLNGVVQCRGQIPADRMQVFGTRATAPDVLAALSSNTCPKDEDGFETIEVSLTDGSSFGPAFSNRCLPDSPLTGLLMAEGDLFAVFCSPVIFNVDASVTDASVTDTGGATGDDVGP